VVPDVIDVVKGHTYGWKLIVAALFLIGVGASLVGAQALARTDSQRSLQASSTSSAEIASALRLAIQREQDLAVNTGAFVISDPGSSEGHFQAWVRADSLFQRFPALIGIGFVTFVTARGLAGYVAGVDASLPPPTVPFRVSPPGVRPWYCFASLTESASGRLTSPTNLDLCATTLGPAFIRTRDSGQSTYQPYGSGRSTDLAVGTAIYAAGSVPTTLAGRQAAFVGWVGLQVAPATILTAALQGHPDTALTFRFGSPSSVAFRSGRAPAGAHEATVNLHNGWSVQVFSAVASGEVFANGNATALFVSGVLFSAVLALLIYVLATSRFRALILVRERTDELRHQALHDPLTGLPNRSLILDRLDHMMLRGRRDHSPVAALFIDLDDFKDINDTLGHAVGDELLVAVGNRLTGALRRGDSVGRLGGDEFVVLAEGASLAGGAVAVADRVLEVLSPGFVIAGADRPLLVTASVGYAEGDRITPGRLLQDADIALYRAKAEGKQRAVGFTPALGADVERHRSMEVDLDAALEREEFFLLYQPTVDLATGDLTGVEALLRWRHPRRGLVMPDGFIPALESSGMILAVGAWVLDEACRQGEAWARAGHRLRVSVNVSGRQMEGDRIIQDVSLAVSRSGFDPALLVLELTETVLIRNIDASLSRLTALKGMGIRIAIDDFGTGYSSLAQLRRFPIDILKIDQSFVAGIDGTAESVALVRALIQLAKVLGLESVAEGIETDDQWGILKHEGVDTGQGYLISRPLDPGAVVGFLTSRAVPSSRTA